VQWLRLAAFIPNAGLCLVFSPLSTVEILCIVHLLSPNGWKNDIEDAQWLDFLRPFNGAKSFYLPRCRVLPEGAHLGTE
jgi:hypothetical protein